MYVQRRRLFKQGLYRRSVFAHNIHIIAARLTVPVLLSVQRPELAETVCRKQNLLRLLVRYHDLRPMYHGSHIKVQGMTAQTQTVPFLYLHFSAAEIHGKKLRQHGKGLGTSHHRQFRILFANPLDIGGMVRLQMGYHQIIRQTPGRIVQFPFQIGKPLLRGPGVHGIHDGDFFVYNQVGIVRYPVRHPVLTFKQVDLMVVAADITHRIRYYCFTHIFPPL